MYLSCTIKVDEGATRKCHNKLKELSSIHERCDEMVSLSSGINATHEIEQDLLRAKEVGKDQAEDFIKNQEKSNWFLRHNQEEQVKNFLFR